jgi:hypothetical protein
MLGINDFPLVSIKKEESIVFKHNHAHPRFKWYLALDALLTTALIYGGVAYAIQPPSHARTSQLEHGGVVAMSSTGLIDHVKSENMISYWLGPISGYTYTPNCVVADAMVVTYLAKNSKIDDPNQANLTVHTYNNLEIYNSMMHPLENANTSIVDTQAGVTVRFNTAAMNYEIVTFKGKPEIVVVNYPTWQLVATLMKNAQALKKIS